MKKVLFFVFFVSSMLCLPSVAKRFTHGFRPAKIQFDFPSHPEWEVEMGAEVEKILSQPFSFFGKGAQCYVFESRDKQYVIKFFRYDLRRPEEKLKVLFNACRLAYENLREETGLIYIHLNQTSFGLPVLQCSDALGRKYFFPMDRMRFLVQKKAKGFRKTLKEAKGDPLLMQKRIDQFLKLLRTRTAKGVRNTDPTLSRNFGFLEESAIEFDFGNYRAVPDLDSKVEILRFTSRLHRWLEREAPEWIPYLDKQINESM